jgi:hypothetical protein
LLRSSGNVRNEGSGAAVAPFRKDMRRPAAEAAHAKNSSIMTPEFEFPNSLIGREQFPQVPPTTATWRTLELSGSATVSLRFGSSAGIAELDCNGALGSVGHCDAP